MNSKYYKHPKYGNTYGLPINTPTGRCAWPHLIAPEPAPPAKPGEPQGAPRYAITIILPKAEKTVQEFLKAVDIMVKEMLVVYNQGQKAKLAIDSILNDGDNFDLEKYPYYRDSWILIARNAKLPSVVDGKKNLIPVEAISGGMFVRANVTPLLTGKGLSFKLEALQRVKDDNTRFAGASRAGSYVAMLPVVDDEGENTESTSEVVSAPLTAETPKNGKAKALAML
jgi:hypothetical protein